MLDRERHTVVVRDIDYDKKPVGLETNEEIVDKDRFFAINSLSTSPVKYKWQN